MNNVPRKCRMYAVSRDMQLCYSNYKLQTKYICVYFEFSNKLFVQLRVALKRWWYCKTHSAPVFYLVEEEWFSKITHWCYTCPVTHKSTISYCGYRLLLGCSNSMDIVWMACGLTGSQKSKIQPSNWFSKTWCLPLEFCFIIGYRLRYKYLQFMGRRVWFPTFTWCIGQHPPYCSWVISVGIS